MRSVDTNVLVRVLTGDEALQSPAAEAFVRAHAPVWVSNLVLVETFWVLESVYERTKPQMVEAMRRIVDNKELALEDATVVRAALVRYQTKGKVSFEDCMILEQARKAGHLPLATFDKALGRIEGAESLSFN